MVPKLEQQRQHEAERAKSGRLAAWMALPGALSLIAAGAIAAEPTVFSAANMVQLSGQTVTGPAFGASTLLRDPQGAHGTVSLGDLGPNTVHSVWALVFNNPDACVREPLPICLPSQDGADAGAAAGLSIFGIAGGISDGSGVLNLEFDLRLKRPANVVIPVFQQDGLTNPLGAEIHFVVAPHPAAVPMLDGPDGPVEASTAFEMTHPAGGTRGAVHQPPQYSRARGTPNLAASVRAGNGWLLGQPVVFNEPMSRTVRPRSARRNCVYDTPPGRMLRLTIGRN